MVNDAPTTILRVQTSQEMELITIHVEQLCTTTVRAERECGTKETVMNTFNTVFKGEVGEFEGEVHLEVDQVVTPVQMPLRKVPVAMRDKLEMELLYIV